MIPPTFNGYEPGPNFDRARSMIATPFQYVDLKLDTATTGYILNISGDFLYMDAASTGVVTFELNNQYNDAAAPFLANPGFGLQAIFKQLKLSWAAQPGKVMRVMYSTGDRVVPTNSTTIQGTVQNDPPRADFTNTNVTVTNASQQFLASNASRKYLLIQNKDSAASVYVVFGATATVAKGVLIGPGGSYELNNNIPNSTVNLIGSTASNANVVIVEG